MGEKGKCYRAVRCKTLRHLVAQAADGADALCAWCLPLYSLNSIKCGRVPAAVEAINGLIIGGINQSPREAST